MQYARCFINNTQRRLERIQQVALMESRKEAGSIWIERIWNKKYLNYVTKIKF